jgi:hypothetical protein
MAAAERILITTDLELTQAERDIAARAVRCYEAHLARIGAEGTDGSEEFLIDALEYYASVLGDQFGPAGLESDDDVETPEVNGILTEIDRCSALAIRLGLEPMNHTSYWDH